MDIHEYQAKERFRTAGIPVPPGEIATTPEQAETIAAQYGGMVVVKAQVHSGGRGKAGGVKLAKNSSEAREYTTAILGMEINGLTVEKVLVTPAVDIDTEAYVGVLVDRKKQAATFMVSAEGGVDIEHVAHETPDLIRKLTVDPRFGILPSPSVLARQFPVRRSRPHQTGQQDHRAALRRVREFGRLDGGDQPAHHDACR